MPRTKILLTTNFTDVQLNRLRSVSSKLIIVPKPQRDWSRSDPSDLFEGDEEIFYGFMPPRNISKTPGLKWVQLHSAGIDHLNGHPILSNNVLLTTASGIHAVPIGEFAIMMMLALARHVPSIVKLQDHSEWSREDTLHGSELRDKTFGIVGYGSIGREAARIAKQGFKMRIIAMTRTDKKEDNGYVERNVGDPQGSLPDAWYRPEQLAELLNQSDFVLITTPLTSQTRNLIGEAELRGMKPSAYIVNVARGGIIDEDALVRALKEHWIAGAGLDVFATEPLPATSALWKLENIIIAPHVSGATPNYNDRAINLFAENLKRYLNGERLFNVVNKSVGY
ncbi:MAG: D-2-hydroxyacid dehydrogenase [Candidatus Bathyarchaeia archaeon]|jgi:phosphoglycerate dehydrogenase-like enzyme